MSKEVNNNKKTYFNKIEFLRALDLQVDYPYDALIEFKKYVEKYPYDYGAYPYYIGALIIFGKAEEAEKLIKKVEMLVEDDNNFKCHGDRYNHFKTHMIFAKMKLLTYLGKYRTAHKLYVDNYNFIKNSKMDLGHVSFYCKKKMGMSIKAWEDRLDSYKYRQMDNYSEELFIEHVKKHMADYNADADLPNENIFMPDFPILKIIDEMKKYIPSDKGLFMGFMEDHYIFKYDGCGRDKNRVVDRFKVVCFHGTTNFITMCPVNGHEGFPCVDLNYMKENNDEKVKRKSRIDRFNMRYNR